MRDNQLEQRFACFVERASQGPAVVTAMQTLKSDSARHADISEEALMVCLHAALDGWVMFLDLRGAHDPEGHPRLRDHIGLHPQILLGPSTRSLLILCGGCGEWSWLCKLCCNWEGG